MLRFLNFLDQSDASSLITFRICIEIIQYDSFLVRDEHLGLLASLPLIFFW
jgi:hypothetical protein